MSGFSTGIFGSGDLVENPRLSPRVAAPQHNPMENIVLRQMLSVQRREHEYSDEAVRLVRDHFNDLTSFRYEHIIGNGVYGIAYSIVEKRVLSRRARRLVVKRALIERAKPELRHEIRVMSVCFPLLQIS